MRTGPPWHGAWSPRLSPTSPSPLPRVPSSYPIRTDPKQRRGGVPQGLAKARGTGSLPHPPTQVHSEYLESPSSGGGERGALLEGLRRPHVVSTKLLAAATGPAHLCAKDSKVCWACVVLPDSGFPQKASLVHPGSSGLQPEKREGIHFPHTLSGNEVEAQVRPQCWPGSTLSLAFPATLFIFICLICSMKPF